MVSLQNFFSIKGRIFNYEGGYLSEGGKAIQRTFQRHIKPYISTHTHTHKMLENATMYSPVLKIVFINTGEWINDDNKNNIKGMLPVLWNDPN